MFSPRLLAVLALVAAAAALPTDQPTDRRAVPRPVTTITDDDFDDTPWFSFPIFGNLLAPLWRLFPSFADIGPRIVSDDDKFQVVVNVKDYKKDDLKVKLKSAFIFVQGSHEAKHDDHDVFASQFYHTYTMPANASAADVTAELFNDGYLVVTAPLNDTSGDKEASVDREVPIIETGKPYQNKTESTTQVQLTTPAATTEDDRKEPTTPSNREDATLKENSIPHGEEVAP